MLIQHFVSLVLEMNFLLTSAQLSNEFVRKFQMDNYTCVGLIQLFVEQHCVSMVECSAICLKSPSCHGIFYDHVSKTCHGCRENARHGLINPNVVAAVRPTEFYIRERVITHGNPCTSSGTCGTNQYCGQDGFCICIPGYSYYAYLNSCGTVCLVYGSSYETHRGMAIGGHNIEDYTTTLAQCKIYCNVYPNCRTIDFGPGCYLQTATALTAAADVQSTNSYDHHHRNCA